MFIPVYYGPFGFAIVIMENFILLCSIMLVFSFAVSGFSVFVQDFRYPHLTEIGYHIFFIYFSLSLRYLICLPLFSLMWGMDLLPVGQPVMPAPFIKTVLCPPSWNPTSALFISSIFRETSPVCPHFFFSWAGSALKYFNGIIRLLISLFRLSRSS